MHESHRNRHYCDMNFDGFKVVMSQSTRGSERSSETTVLLNISCVSSRLLDKCTNVSMGRS